MELIKQSAVVENVNGIILNELIGIGLIRHIERAGRTCYKSEDKNAEMDIKKTEKFVKSIIDRGHHSVLEHANITVRFITNRGTTHELVRHRLAAYSQESTRYCNYGNDHVKFVIPHWTKNIKPGIYHFVDKGGFSWIECFNNSGDREKFECFTEEHLWIKAMYYAEHFYKEALVCHLPPQDARGVLPIDLKTEIVMTANLREWRHVFSLRTSKAAHPQIRALMLGLLAEIKLFIPVVFDDIDKD